MGLYYRLGVRLGEYDTETNPDCLMSRFGDVDCAPEPVNFGIEQKIVHERYSLDINNHNDIALLRLNRNVDFTGWKTHRLIFLYFLFDFKYRFRTTNLSPAPS